MMTGLIGVVSVFVLSVVINLAIFRNDPVCPAGSDCLLCWFRRKLGVK